MPGTTVGTQLPKPRKTLLAAEVHIWEQDGVYTSKVRPLQPGALEEDAPAQELREFVENLAKRLNEGRM
jgi:hypothetical protein